MLMTDPCERIIDQSATPEDVAVELSLRPSLLDEFVGQHKVKDNLKLYIEAAKQRKHCHRCTLLLFFQFGNKRMN